MNPPPDQKRTVIEHVTPVVDGGRHALKRIVGELFVVEADIFSDSHDALGAVLKHRCGQEAPWTEVAMTEIACDRWRGGFPLSSVGVFQYTIEAWLNPFLSWWRLVERKLGAGMPVADEFSVAAALFEELAGKATPVDAARFREWRNLALSGKGFLRQLREPAAREAMNALATAYRDARRVTAGPAIFEVVVDPVLARCSAWYEVFPRSCAQTPGRHGTLLDLMERLPLIADMGFDVVYLPPIHPIGHTARKGRNNSLVALSADPGSVWGIGSVEGGHKAVHPELGTVEDVRLVLGRARELGLEIALDIAFQCAPDHPYVKQHPEWFSRQPDGAIRCAENPPHRYDDVYPLDFECSDWQHLWLELRSVFEFWAQNGVRVFRVDNPHTKPFPFWEWTIQWIKRLWPGTIFLSEGLTRPSGMKYLAKIGFSQSHDYFPWRNSKEELTAYYGELARTETRDFFRPVLWPNTPQLLPPLLHGAPPQAFAIRFILAATLGASYGIYGPAFELCENRPVTAGSEDYLDSEQYELKHWNWNRNAGLRPLIAKVNALRRANPALHSNASLQFHGIDNPQMIAYSKATQDLENTILIIVNMDARHTQSGWTALDCGALGVRQDGGFEVHDLLSGEHYAWRGARNYIQLNPTKQVAHLLTVCRK